MLRRMRSDMRATTLPCSTSVSMRMPRTFTIANSEATKNALAASSRMTSMMVSSMVAQPRGPPFVLAGAALEQAPQHSFGDVVGKERLADAAHQHEAASPRGDLLVTAHRIQHPFGVKAA